MNTLIKFLALSLFGFSCGIRLIQKPAKITMDGEDDIRSPEMGPMDAFLYAPSESTVFKSFQLAKSKEIEIPHEFIWHMHFHKAAGTSIGQLAIKNGLKLAPYESDTHGHLDLGEHNIRNTSADQIVERLKTLRNSGVGFGSTEHWFPEPDKLLEIQAKAPWVKFMTVLRDPVQRTLSSYYFHRGKKGGGHRCQGLCSIKEFAYAESNMMTRMLNGKRFGPDALKQRPAELSADAAAIQNDPVAVTKALSVLRTFALVLTQEKLDAQETRDLIQKKLGWSNQDFPHGNSNPHAKKETEEDMLEIEKLNKLDYQLYNSFAGA